jgi:ABC-type iron transport system FetAB permease component
MIWLILAGLGLGLVTLFAGYLVAGQQPVESKEMIITATYILFATLFLTILWFLYRLSPWKNRKEGKMKIVKQIGRWVLWIALVYLIFILPFIEKGVITPNPAMNITIGEAIGGNVHNYLTWWFELFRDIVEGIKKPPEKIETIEEIKKKIKELEEELKLLKEMLKRLQQEEKEKSP